MIIRVRKNWKDSITRDPNHLRLTRRDFIERGLLTGAMSIGLPATLIGGATRAFADCAPKVRNGGGLAQLYLSGGGSACAYLMSGLLANAASGSNGIANSYGVDGSSLASLGPGSSGGNFAVAANSAFGAALIAGAPGYTPAQWRAVLSKCSLGTIHGALTRDDGGEPESDRMITGLGKRSAGKDISSGNETKLLPFQGVPSSAVPDLTVQNLADTYSATPPGQTNTQTIINSANAATNLSNLFSGFFGLDKRKGGSNVQTAASCGFIGDAVPMGDPNYGLRLYDPAQQPSLTGNLTGLTAAELAMLGAFHASARGDAGAVCQQFEGYDYHGSNNVAPEQIAAARAIVMFLLACDKAGQKGVFILATNGSAGGGGARTQANQTIGGNSLGVTTITVKDTTPTGDQGGAQSTAHALFFDPNGSPPTTKNIGSVDLVNGDTRADAKVTTAMTAISGLYYSAALWLGSTTMDIDKIKSSLSKVGVNPEDGRVIS